MQYTLNPYRVSINASLLESSAKELLGATTDAASLAKLLGWAEVPDYIWAGVEPYVDGKQVVEMVKNNARRVQLKEARIAKGYTDPNAPRKGISGWLQSNFSDAKENALPVELEIYDWLQRAPRFSLLITLHDSLLSMVSIAEPKQIDFQEITGYPNPISEMIYKQDLKRADRMANALTCKVGDIPPQVLIEDVAGYVVNFQQARGLGYYYG